MKRSETEITAVDLLKSMPVFAFYAFLKRRTKSLTVSIAIPTQYILSRLRRLRAWLSTIRR